MRSFKWSAAALAIVGATVIAACGGSDTDQGGSNSEPLTHDELIEAADQICADYDAAAEKLELPSDIPADEDLDELDPKHIEVLSAYIGDGIDLFNTQVDALAALTPPQDQSSDWNALIDDLEAMKAAFADGHEAVDDANQEAFDEFNAKVSELGSAASKKARGLGLKECGS